MDQVLNSTFSPLGRVQFPPFMGRQVRYQAFDLAHIQMPDELKDYLIPVTNLCRLAGAKSGTAYLTIDEKVIEAGMSQRRPKPHVDGCFLGINASRPWGGGGGGWLHYCNDVGASKIGRMAVIVAATVPGCKAWKGTFNGRPAMDGDLSHISDQLGVGEVLKPNVGYLLSPDCVHESMTFDQQTMRSFLRIALPTSFSDVCVWD